MNQSFLLRRLVVACSVALVSQIGSPAFALNPSLPPSGNFDLTHWKLTLPVTSSGATSGTPAEIQPSDLSNNAYYSQSPYTTTYAPYFYTASGDGAMVFYCPTLGAKTGNTSFPRCELREMLNPSDDTVNWTDVGTHTLTATAKVVQVATSTKVIVGQIHGTDAQASNANPLVKLQFELSGSSYRLRALCKQTASGSTDDTMLFSGTSIALNTNFTYTITLKDKTLKVVVNGVTGTISGKTANADGSYAMDSSWDALFFYFKAGNYNQDSSGDSSAADVRFSAVAASHGTAPNITTTSLANGRTTIGYSQQLSATGGTTPYTWSIASGSLPTGLGLSSAGLISGTPTTAGTSTFTVKVTDAASQTDTQSLSITVAANSVPNITTTTLPGATVGVAYNQSVSSTGGDGAIGWSISSGSLPAGLTLSNVNSPTCTISGTPTTAGTASFTLKLVDVDGDNDTQALSIAVSAPSQVATPSFSPAGGSYSSAQTVTISSSTSGASIRYTVDGSTPTKTSGTLYSAPVSIPTTTTLKAIAYASGFTDSAVASATYTISGAGSVTATAGGAWQNSVMAAQSGTFTATFDATPSASPNDALVALSLGAQTSFTGFACLVRFNPAGDIDVRNGGTYSAASTIPFSANTTYHFRVVTNLSAHTYSVYVTPAGGSELTVGSNYAFRTEQNTVSSLDHWGVFVDTAANGGAGTLTVSNFIAQVAAPAFSPAGGSYTGTQTVTISSATSGASIRYTTDGSTPTSTTGTLYSGPVSVSATSTLTAIAYESGLSDSSIASATYTIGSGGGNTVPVVLEAESVSFDSNWQNISDANAYGGHALQALSNSTSSAPSNGGLVYSFTLGSSSTIYVQTRSRSPNGGSSDSVWLRLDGGSWQQFVQGGTNSYTWSNKSFSSVASGSHTFEIRYREAGAVLDQVAVTLTSSAPN